MSAKGKKAQAGPVIRPEALEPLFEPWEEPNFHRVRADKEGGPAKKVKGRRPSPVVIVQNLRSAVREWREAGYPGASDTTRELLVYWFERPHRSTTASGDECEFRYYFCQREAIETLVFLKEVRQLECLSQIVGEFGGPDAEVAALGIPEEEDAWTRYAFKIATGAGKTKIMSLVVVWSYFHALRESDSEMAKHFVVIAPNLTVYERLKEDFGDGRIFDTDPLIPPEWRGDWNVSTVLQDDARPAAGGVIYLTNIHRLYDLDKRKRKKEAETYSFMGPPVSKAKALDTGEALRARITAHQRLMVLNDEAHHLWDPQSAWNEAIRYLHETVMSRTGGGIMAQLDFTATPKDNKGQRFKHIICDTPLGEAVDGGIVKTPIIGRSSKKLTEEPTDDAAYKYDRHLRLGYERWLRSKDEWDKSGKKALLFVMCEDTEAADQIAQRLNTDETFAELNRKTINLHTRLKGKVKKVGKGAGARQEFMPSEKEISDEDLKELRKLSRELDTNESPYFCIVSVLMLREGWDVRNVTTIVPLRPYTSKANILPEQTLGRGLRRMTPPGSQGANEIVTVVEHQAFASLYQQELAQEGLLIEIIDVDHIPVTTVTIFPDEARKNVDELEIEVPALAAGHKTVPKLKGLTVKDVDKAFGKYKSLPLAERIDTEIEYEGRHLITNEIIERMKLHLPLLETGFGAVSYFVKQIEQVCRLRGLHASLAALVQHFLEDVLFEDRTTLADPKLVARLGDSDVQEHVRAVFVPLVRSRTTTVEERVQSGEPMKLSQWKPFQVTHSERKPALEAHRTLFNLVPCNRALEVGMAKFADNAGDVAAFAKNAGPQCLRIDYLAAGGRLAFYTPDFFVRTTDGKCFLVETKGREDVDVPRKARAAVAWCEAASTSGTPWEYVYVPQGVFESLTGSTMASLMSTCAPSLQNLLHVDTEEELPLFTMLAEAQEEGTGVEGIVDPALLEELPSRYRKAVEESVAIYHFLKNKETATFAPVFVGLLSCVDEAAKGLMRRKLQSELPAAKADRKAWFRPYLEELPEGRRRHYGYVASNLEKTLVRESGLSPLGLLRDCLEYALTDETELGGVFVAVKAAFAGSGAQEVFDAVAGINSFRNTYVAHQKKPLGDAEATELALRMWIEALPVMRAF